MSSSPNGSALLQDRQRVSTGGAWEKSIGYSRAVRVDRTVYVSGTAAPSAVGASAPPDVRAQTRETIERIAAALDSAGAALSHVVQTRIYVTRMSDWPAVGEVHAEFFGDVLPATTLVEVSALIDPGLLVEIEAVAVVPEQ